MPARDGSGPLGRGPGTGRGMGGCVPDQSNWGPGRGFFRRGGFGGGRGWRHWFNATGLPRWARWGTAPSREQEVDMLKNEAEMLKEQLDAINKRVDELSRE